MKFCYISMGSSVLRSFCLTVFLLSFSVNSQQLADYEVLESLSDNVSNKQNNKTNIPNDEFPDNENIIDSAPKNISDYTDENYSYFGDDEFNTSQKKRYNQEPLKHFGYDYFSNVPDTYAQVKNIPIPPEYLIGPGDNIKVILFGKENDEFTLEVSRSGEIFLPEIGPIYLAGLTFKDMQKTIQNIVTNKIIGTEVNVTLGELRNINIFVLGEAFQPGMYTVSALSTLTNSIFLSGGVSQNGSLRNIQLKRNGAVVSSFDFYDLLLNGDTSQDVRLSSGDVVFIPQAKKTVGIEGEVFRPGIYEVNEDESIQDLIRFAGSLKPKGDSNNIEILRVDKQKNGFSMLDIDQNNTNSTSLNYGDVVRVSSVSNNMNNAVLIKGHFQRTGFYPLSEGSKIGDLITPKNILAMTDLNYVLIKRENIINSKYQYIQIDLNKVFEDPNSDNNILIQDRDEIILLPRLIAKEQIETMLINESDISDLNKGYSEPDNMQSMSLLRRSIIKQQEAEEAPIYAEMATDDNIQDEKDYYEYQVYDYCVVPKEAIFELVTPDMPIDLTEICRRQLLNPVIDIINRYNSGQNQKTTVQVFGNVHFPGEYPLTINMSLRDAIKASGGLKDNTYSSQIELTSQNLFDKAITANRKSYSIEEDIESKNILLKSNDLITIK